MKRVNVAVVGCGFIAETAHIPNIMRIPEFKLVAICDSDKERLNRIGEKFNIRERTEHPHKLLGRSDVEAAVICTPTRTHCEITLSAAERGKHVFVEKPMATNSRDAQTMIDAAERNRVKLVIGHMMRFLPNHQKCKQIMEAKQIGEVFHIESYSETPIIKAEDGILLDYATHFIELLLWYLNKPKIEAVGTLLGFDKEGKTDTRAIISLHFDRGITGSIQAFWMPEYSCWEAMRRQVSILGTRGKIATEQSGPTITMYKEGSLISRVRGPVKIMPSFAIHSSLPLSEIAYRRELEDFRDSIIKDKHPAVGGEVGKTVLLVVDAVRKSHLERKFVVVEK